ncbi:class I adenylate-forming enzyme family protein [Cupriavidus basilensis]|uniref:class I adenylate-forming enzyme family protein n=1 Tax=Cupriavidus basilensis TaxID=68895 RepID=UPI0023E8854F|nr:AMP-binding protein [Cupriavidus basilensis]MDF3881043.1 AMP-binding protein [Cupriavidus basilensis]
MIKPITIDLVWMALKRNVALQPDRAALIYQGRAISFAELDRDSDHLACGLIDLGFCKGDRLGVLGLNQPEWLLAYLAAAKIGAIVVGLSVRYRDSEIEYIVNHAKVRAIIAPAVAGNMDYVAYFASMGERLPSIQRYFFMGRPDLPASQRLASLLGTPVERVRLDRAQADIVPDDPLVLIYTSGTTGRPKGALITHRSQLASATAECSHLGLQPDDLMVLALPLNHVGGLTCGFLAMLLGGGTSLLIPTFSPKQVIADMLTFPPTIVAGVPTMHTLLLREEGIGQLDRQRVRLVITGGANADPNLLQQLQEVFPQARVMNLYGLSETSGAALMSPWDSNFEAIVRSVGKPLPGVELRIVTPDGHDAAPGEPGELWIRGELSVAGYLDMPDETAASFSDGWLRTGDLGYCDDCGLVTLLGRSKEMFVQGGFNVYPIEVENALSRHPDVLMVAGIGVPDPVLGEVGLYYVVPKPGAQPSAETLTDYCRMLLADYKVPRQIVFCESLPMTPAGKIMKARLWEERPPTGLTQMDAMSAQPTKTVLSQ